MFKLFLVNIIILRFLILCSLHGSISKNFTSSKKPLIEVSTSYFSLRGKYSVISFKLFDIFVLFFITAHELSEIRFDVLS